MGPLLEAKGGLPDLELSYLRRLQPKPPPNRTSNTMMRMIQPVVLMVPPTVRENLDQIVLVGFTGAKGESWT